MRTLDKLWTTHRGGKCDGFTVLLRLDCNSAQLAQSSPQFPPKGAVLPFLLCPVEMRQQHRAADERNRRQTATNSPTVPNHRLSQTTNAVTAHLYQTTSDSPHWLNRQQ